MIIELKNTMRNNNLINEAEMFCTDLEFRMDQNGRTREFIGDLAKKQDDVVRNIQEIIKHLTTTFKKKLKVKAESAGSNKMFSLAVCVYVASYFRLSRQNGDSESLFSIATPYEREQLLDFW